MRAHYLQHVPFEGLGSIEEWLVNRNFNITSTQFYKNQALPDIKDIDLLIVLGGPMSVNDINDYPWIVEEKRFIQSAIEAGKAVLGICLGAQFIASAMDAKIYPNTHKEIGWFPVQSVKSDNDNIFHFPKELEVFHWHGETFDLPEGAILLAQTEGCQNQAFQLGSKVIGLQFHLETTEASARAMVSHCGDELVDGKYIQTEEDILSRSSTCYASINTLMGDILTYILKIK